MGNVQDKSAAIIMVSLYYYGGYKGPVSLITPVDNDHDGAIKKRPKFPVCYQKLKLSV